MKRQYTRRARQPKFRGTYTDWGVSSAQYARDNYPEPFSNAITLIIGITFSLTMFVQVTVFGAFGAMLILFAFNGFKEDARKRKAGYIRLP